MPTLRRPVIAGSTTTRLTRPAARSPTRQVRPLPFRSRNLRSQVREKVAVAINNRDRHLFFWVREIPIKELLVQCPKGLDGSANSGGYDFHIRDPSHQKTPVGVLDCISRMNEYGTKTTDPGDFEHSAIEPVGAEFLIVLGAL